jgi:hypothetical protein
MPWEHHQRGPGRTISRSAEHGRLGTAEHLAELSTLRPAGERTDPARARIPSAF